MNETTTTNTRLSPAAQAVLDAFNEVYESDRHAVAAALRAAADQLMPLTKTPWGSTLIPILTAEESRNGLLAIAAELEALQ
jgi:hypothetical protein